LEADGCGVVANAIDTSQLCDPDDPVGCAYSVSCTLYMAMQKTVTAVFEDGVLKPLESVDLPEHQRVKVTIEVRSPEEVLAGWRSVYDGLSADEIDEIERIALDRSHFLSFR
jgi:predicted DNA-binding antitoxin AbrB/MazE fold protein